MNCSTHPDQPAVAFCRTCGKALCADCRKIAHGIVYCEEHAAVATPPPAPALPAGRSNPRLAFVLGLVPGVGAIYNEQYAKGLVHALLFGVLISIIDSPSTRGFGPLFFMATVAFIFYMAFEAHHTARKRNLGQPVDEFSSILEVRAQSSLAGAVTLIALGVVFLLNTLDIVNLSQILRFWPVLLIALGASMLHSRLSEAHRAAEQNHQEAQHERQ